MSTPSVISDNFGTSKVLAKYKRNKKGDPIGLVVAYEVAYNADTPYRISWSLCNKPVGDQFSRWKAWYYARINTERPVPHSLQAMADEMKDRADRYFKIEKVKKVSVPTRNLVARFTPHHAVRTCAHCSLFIQTQNKDVYKCMITPNEPWYWDQNNVGYKTLEEAIYA